MAIFGRSRGRTDRAVTDFWAWWRSSGRALALPKESGGDPTQLDVEITPRVAAIDEQLSWETAPGVATPHRLIVTASGDAGARSNAQRWWLARPVDADWEFLPFRPSSPEMFEASITIADAELELGKIGFLMNLDPESCRIEVVVVHPDFGRVPHGAAMEVAFMALDWAIGEDAVSRWIGEVTVESGVLDAEVSRQQLQHEVELQVESARALRDSGIWWWLDLKYRDAGSAIGRFRAGTRWTDRPELDLLSHVNLVLGPNNTAIPGAEDDPVKLFEAQLRAAIGDRGLVLVNCNRGKYRDIFAYTESGDGETRRAIRRIVKTMPRAAVRQQRDPGWTRIEKFLR